MTSTRQQKIFIATPIHPHQAGNEPNLSGIIARDLKINYFQISNDNFKVGLL